jgi:hypothetical protein
MSNYTKDKNIITFNIDGTNGTFKFDIATGIFYGIKGNPVKVVAKKSAICGMLYHNYTRGWSSQLEYTLYYMFDYSNQTSRFPSYIKALETAEKLDNMKLRCGTLSNRNLEYIGDNFKEFVAYLKTRSDEDKENGVYRMNEFNDYCQMAKARKAWGEGVVKLFPEEIFARLMNYNEVLEYSAEDITTCAYYLVRGKMHEYNNGDYRRLLEYFSMCKGMNKTPQRENNFMREFCETQKEYELRKIEFDNARIRANYKKHSKALTFEYGDYMVVCPTTAQDLIDEGRNMHHCVGGYTHHIINGSEYIVFIRRKDNPTQCYLTCEIYNDGRIGQYYLAYDRTISTTEDIAFKTAFQNHLLENWGE